MFAFGHYTFDQSTDNDIGEADITEESEWPTTTGISTAASIESNVFMCAVSGSVKAHEGIRNAITARIINAFFMVYTSFDVIISNV